MGVCDVCKKEIDTPSMKKCIVCGLLMCEECSYFSSYYTRTSTPGKPEEVNSAERYLCEDHMLDLLKNYNESLLMQMRASNFEVTEEKAHGDTVILYIGKLKGKNLERLVNEALDWMRPYSEWKDWNTM
jgi:hypothetical protein